MFIADLHNDFYNKLIGKRILVIVNYDIDAICACKILQTLFRYDHMLYTLVPIMGVAGLKRTYQDHRGDIKYVLLINCGGCLDLIDVLQPDDDVEFFVCDAHRPLDVCNIYNDRQVRIIGELALEENIPEFEAIFHESESEEDSDDEDDNNENLNDVENADEESDKENSDDVSTEPKRKLSRIEKMEQRIAKQRQRRNWETERDRIMFDYTQYNYYGRSSALIMFEVAWKLTKDDLNLLWYAIVGVSEQLILGKIESSVYALDIENIQAHVSRLTQRANDQHSLSASKISFENDLQLVLYRHWCITESMKHSMYVACKLKLWTLRGEKKLQELFVEMGLPLMQARQTYTSMDLELRQEVFTMFEKLAEKYGIPDIVYGSFTLLYGYCNRYSGADYVYALLAILESVKKDKKPEDCFLECLDALSRDCKNLLDNGINNAKLLLNAIFKQVHSSLEAHQVHSTGSFFYYVLNEENAYFSCPYGLLILAKFILNGYVAISRSRHAKELPLIASCPVDVDSGLCLLVGIPPVGETSTKNFFGKAFEQAANKSNAAILQDFFECSLIQIQQNDLTRFLDALTVLLT